MSARDRHVIQNRRAKQSGNDRIRLIEDFSFCALAADAGFPIWALVDADIGHVGADME